MADACGKCGEVHDPKRCSKHSSRTGLQCGKSRGLVTTNRGDLVCFTHGGQSPQVRAAVTKRVEAQEAGKRLAALITSSGAKTTDDVDEIIREMLRRSQQVLAAYELMLREDPDARILIDVDYGRAGGSRKEQHQVAVLWDKERDRLSRLAIDAAKVGIAERAVRVQEEQVRQFVAVIFDAITAAGLAPDDVRKVKEAIVQRARALAV